MPAATRQCGDPVANRRERDRKFGKPKPVQPRSRRPASRQSWPAPKDDGRNCTARVPNRFVASGHACGPAPRSAPAPPVSCGAGREPVSAAMPATFRIPRQDGSGQTTWIELYVCDNHLRNCRPPSNRRKYELECSRKSRFSIIPATCNVETRHDHTLRACRQLRSQMAFKQMAVELPARTRVPVHPAAALHRSPLPENARRLGGSVAG